MSGRRDDGRFVQGGLVDGAADIIGVLGPNGRWFCLEAKTGAGKPNPEQRAFLELVRSRGGFATVVWSVDGARAAYVRAKRGARS